MSIAIIKIDNRKLTILRKFIHSLNGKIRVLRNEEEQEKQIMLKLIEESDNSKVVPDADVKKYFLKYGIKI